MTIRNKRHSVSDREKRPVFYQSLVKLLALSLFSNLLTIAVPHQAQGCEAAHRLRSTQVTATLQDIGSDEKDARPLEPGHPVSRELSGGQRDCYRLRLDAGQYVKAIIDQQGIDVVEQISGPDGALILEFDYERRPQGREEASLVAESAGDYQLVVQSKQKGAGAGNYEIRIEELRAATDNDRALHEAYKTYYQSYKLYVAAKFDEALPLVQEALDIRERILGPYHRDVAAALNRLAIINAIKGEYAKAEQLYQRALLAFEKALNPEHPEVASTLNNLAILYKTRGEYAKAEGLYQRALFIKEKTMGPDHSEVAALLNNLAILYHDKGEYAKAEPLYLRALSAREKLLGGQDHPEVATILSNLASLYFDKGDYAKAESLNQRALRIKEKTLSPTHREVAQSLNNLSNIYCGRGDYAEAERLLLRAIQIKEKALSPDHPEVARSLGNLANVYYDQGAYEKAEPLYQRELSILENALGPDHPDVAYSLNSLGNIYLVKGEYAKGEPLYERALSILETEKGPNHPEVGITLYRMALNFGAKGDIDQAVAFQRRANLLLENNLETNLALGSERQKLAYLALFSKQTDFTLWLHSQAAPNDPQALDLAFTTLLHHKGRGLDAMANSIAALRRRASSQDRDLFDQLSAARSQLAALMLRESNSAEIESYRTRTKPLEERIENLEARLSANSAEFRAQTEPGALAAIQSELPAGSALVEFVTFAPLDPRSEKPKAPRYLAYILTSQGAPKWVDLGEAAPIERAVGAWRQSLRENGVDVKQLGRAVDELVMRPVRSSLPSESGKIRRLLIAPDGSLNLAPFAAMVDEQNRYLIERYSISFLTSGRDLLRLRNPQPSRSAPLILANPLFGRMASASSRVSRNHANSRFSARAGGQGKPRRVSNRVFFPPLPGTEDEALALKSVLPEASLLLHQEATEAALKRASGPRILHIATHGFFLREQEEQNKTSNVSSPSVMRLSDLRLGKWATHIENPLLRSGLALSGANSGKAGDDDGLLTALEVSGLDLWGTKLVALSACDTGLGEIKNGEGVQGLRRALVLAGSESQIISLWAVPDELAKEIIIPYYKMLRQGEGRGEGLRQVQLRMLRSKDRRHPYYWASFIQSGEWGNLDGRR